MDVAIVVPQRDESLHVNPDAVRDAVLWEQYERFRRGAENTPREFRLTGLHGASPTQLEFAMRGELDAHLVTVESHAPSNQLAISCSCPDSYLCKHTCWLLFKVLKHADLDVFSTRCIPSALLGEMFDSEDARTHMVDTWSTGGHSFPLMPDAELSDRALTPLKAPEKTPTGCTFGPPTCWPPPEIDCIICDYGMERAEARQCSVCHRCFDSACINKWFLHNMSCPTCRAVPMSAS